jgi:hypothetical protein
MQAEILADLRACEPARTECTQEIERDRSQQDLGFQKPNAVCRIASGFGEFVFIRLSM